MADPKNVEQIPPGELAEEIMSAGAEQKEAPKKAAPKPKPKAVAKAKPAAEPAAKPEQIPFVPPKCVRVLVTILGHGMTLGGKAVYRDEIHEVSWAQWSNASKVNPGGTKIQLEDGGEWMFSPPEFVDREASVR